MKIRAGFVSNSSSSSFVIIGREIDIMKVTPKILKEKSISVLGESLGDGQDVFQVTTIEELAFLKALKKIEADGELTVIESYVFSEDEDYAEFDVSRLPKKGKVKCFNGWMDYNSSETLETLKRRYDDFGKTESIMQRYLRSSKLDKIEKNNQ